MTQENEPIPQKEDEILNEASAGQQEPAAAEQKQPASKFGRKVNRKKIVYFALSAVFTVTFIISAAFLVQYFLESFRADSEYDDLAGIVESNRNQLDETEGTDATDSTDPTGSTDSTDSTDATDATDPTEDPGPQILPEYQDIYELNNDLVGWIKIEGTTVNYPVMQTSVDNANYYLDHTFTGESSKWGCIYVREQCDVFAPSDNVTIYGHYKSDGTMFHDLHNLRKKAYWKEHRYIQFDTIYERHTYEIIAVFKTSANYGQGFSYHIFDDAKDKADFNKFVDTVHSLQYFNTGVTAEYGDKLITLSTCEYTLDNGRLVVVAKRIS